VYVCARKKKCWVVRLVPPDGENPYLRHAKVQTQPLPNWVQHLFVLQGQSSYIYRYTFFLYDNVTVTRPQVASRAKLCNEFFRLRSIVLHFKKFFLLTRRWCIFNFATLEMFILWNCLFFFKTAARILSTCLSILTPYVEKYVPGLSR
jgi:hypothetical protein